MAVKLNTIADKNLCSACDKKSDNEVANELNTIKLSSVSKFTRKKRAERFVSKLEANPSSLLTFSPIVIDLTAGSLQKSVTKVLEEGRKSLK